MFGTVEENRFCMDSRGVQPKQLAALIQQKSLSQPPDIQDAIVGIGAGEAKQQPLLKYSCSKGFRSLTVPHLKLLWRRLKVTTSAPPQTTWTSVKRNRRARPWHRGSRATLLRILQAGPLEGYAASLKQSNA